MFLPGTPFPQRCAAIPLFSLFCKCAKRCCGLGHTVKSLSESGVQSQGLLVGGTQRAGLPGMLSRV